MRKRMEQLLAFGVPVSGGGLVATMGNQYFVDTVDGYANRNGRDPDKPLNEMAAALATVESGDRVYFRGDVREEATGSNLAFDVTIIGVGNRPHHADVPGAGYHPGASVWRPPASPTAATPLLKVRGRGWRFENILFDAPVDAAAVRLERNALSGTAEFDPSHASFVRCQFRSGKYALEDAGGCFNVLVDDCDFYSLSEAGGAAIITTSTAVALPLCWTVRNCRFIENVNHIKVSASRWVVGPNNVFMKHTTDAINLKAVGAQGEYNTVYGNALGGTFSIVGGYTPGANDEWGGNFNSLAGGVTAADPA
jgi:hypothetical protein